MIKHNFRNLITIMKFEDTEDALGNQIQEWVEHGKAWAAIKTMQGREYYAAATAQAIENVRFIIRYIPGIDSTMQIEYKNETYLVESVMNDNELNETITIVAHVKNKGS